MRDADQVAIQTHVGLQPVNNVRQLLWLHLLQEQILLDYSR